MPPPLHDIFANLGAFNSGTPRTRDINLDAPMAEDEKVQQFMGNKDPFLVRNNPEIRQRLLQLLLADRLNAALGGKQTPSPMAGK